MGRRLLRSNTTFDELFAMLDPSDEEIDAVTACLKLLEDAPQEGIPFVYSGYAGEHWLIECGRFLVVYQFSASEVRPKDIRLK